MKTGHAMTILGMLGILGGIAAWRSGRAQLLAGAINGSLVVGPPGSAAASKADRSTLGHILNPDPGPAVSAPGTTPAPLPGTTPAPLPGAHAPTPKGTVPLPGLLTPRDTGGQLGYGPSIGGTGRSWSAA